MLKLDVRPLVVAALLCAAACASQPAPAQGQTPKSEAMPPASKIVLRESCGYITTCPEYQITLTPDGHYVFQGYKNVSPMGAREGELGKEAWTKAEAALAAAKWQTLPDAVRSDDNSPCMPDSPGATIQRWEVSGKVKDVGLNLGCKSALASKLLGDIRAAIPRPAADPPQQAAVTSKAFVKLYESPCYFPTCVSYEIEVHPDGSYRLDGQKNTRTEGVTQGKLAPDAYTKAVAALTAAKFAGMPAELTVSKLMRPGGVPCMNDLPDVTFTQRSESGEEKSVKFSTGCNVPEARKLLEDLRAAFNYTELVRKPQ
jgi:hypothetical protein